MVISMIAHWFNRYEILYVQFEADVLHVNDMPV